MIVYRASELGSCTRRLVLGRVGYEPKDPPPKYAEYFARGDVTEEEVKTDLRAARWMVSREQEEVVLNITDEIKVVGHIDGALQRDDMGLGPQLTKERLLEVKRMNDAYWNVVREGGFYVDGLMEKYRWQQSAYMLATGLELTMICRNGDTGEDHYLYAETPFYTHNDIAARVLVVEGRARSFTTLDFPCDQADYPCPFYYTHANDREELDGEEAEAIEGLGIAYQIARGRERDAKAAAELVRDDLRKLLGTRDRIVAGRVKVTTYDTTRTKLDKKAAIADGIDLSKYESTSTSTTVRVTVREEIENADEAPE